MIRTSIGFIGAGVLASSLASGLCRSGEFDGEIFVWNRSPERAEEMRAICPERVHIVGSPSDVCAKSEVVVPALLPKAMAQVMSETTFRAENSVVHVTGGVSLAESAAWYAPARVAARAVPLPFTKRGIGPFAIFGADDKICGLVSLAGSLVEARSEHELTVLAVVTAMMASYIALVGETVEWCASHGVDFATALDFTNYMNEAISETMRLDCEPSHEGVERMIEHFSTPGGFNELALKTLRASGGLAPWKEGLDAVGAHYIKG